MKLLSPTEARDKAKRSKEADNHRLVEVQTLITNKLKELGEVEKTFDETMQRQRNQWAAEQQEHENKVLSLRKTVEALEERKRIALLPLTEKEAELDTKASALDEREKALDEREEDLDSTGASLIVRLDEVAEREIQASKVGTVLTLKEQGIQAQAAQIVTASAALNVAIAKETTEAAARAKALDLRGMALKAKEGNISERERKMGEKEGDLVKRELALKDERYALTEAVREIEQKYGTQQTIQRHPIRSDSD